MIDAAINIAQAADTGASGFLTSFGLSSLNAAVQIAGYAAKAAAGAVLNNQQAVLQSDSLQASIENRVQDWTTQLGWRNQIWRSPMTR